MTKHLLRQTKTLRATGFFKRRTSEDLEGDKMPPAPDQDLEGNWVFKSLSGCYQFVGIVHV